jgi:hypothetical protein
MVISAEIKSTAKGSQVLDGNIMVISAEIKSTAKGSQRKTHNHLRVRYMLMLNTVP